MNGSGGYTPGLPEIRVMYEFGIGFPRSTLGTAVEPIQMSALVLSIGIEVILNSPSNSPHCSAISTAENVTASTPGAYRERSCHRVWRAMDIGDADQGSGDPDYATFVGSSHKPPPRY